MFRNCLGMLQRHGWKLMRNKNGAAQAALFSREKMKNVGFVSVGTEK